MKSTTPPPGLAGSASLRERAGRSLAGGVSTAFRSFERPAPLFVRSAAGCRLIDADGRSLLDFTCGFGPVILGHGHPRVAEAVAHAAATLQQPAAQHEGEVELAELLCAIVPSFELVRFSLTGSEAVHAALRLARAATGRRLVVKFAGHYHGWFDGVYAATAHVAHGVETLGQSAAALDDLIVTDFNDGPRIEAVFAEHGPRIAAVIMEPIPCNQGCFTPDDGYLEHVRRLCTDHGALLVFDEVITGFRVGLAGAQGVTGVTPDLTVVAKAMANGFPISAFGGRRDLMELVGDNTALHAGTFNGGGVSVAAALATVRELQESSPYARMQALGGRLMRGLEAAAGRHGHRLVAQGPGPVFFAWFLDAGGVQSYADHRRADAARYARFAELMLEEDVRVIGAGRWYLNAAHDEAAVDDALVAADRALARL